MVSMLSLSYMGFSIVAGIFLGRFGIKPAVLSGFAVLILGLFSIFFMPGFFSTAAALVLVFAGFGFFDVGINALASRAFTSKTAMLMNMLGAFYGIGAIIGPKIAGLLVNNAGLGWRYIYLLSLPLALALFISGIFIKFPDGKHSRSTMNEAGKAGGVVNRKSFFDALRSPMVWLFSLTLGLATIIEMNSANWGVLYFYDIYGMDPTTSGAAFLSVFFIVFTLSRFFCGAFVERIGYIRSLTGLAYIILLIFTTGFLLGARGIYVLPALGFFVALLWPTIMALAVVRFGDDAPVMCSAIIAIGGAANAGAQYLVGLTNRFFGPAWGYRSSLLYTVLLIGALFLLRKKLSGTKWA
jgi:fucose permease